jgi:hypothetical protein
MDTQTAGAVSIVHVFESPGSVEYGFTCDRSGANLPPPKGGAWKHWRTVDIGERAEREVGVDPDAIAEGIRAQGYFVSEIDDLPTI